MNLLFLTFGPNLKNHYQANFAILSFLQYRSALKTIFVYTDHPEFYIYYRDYVTVVPITKSILEDWKGEYDFFWRVKIKAIEQIIAGAPGVPLVYLDSDTFLYRDIKGFTQALLGGAAFMHQQESRLSESKNKTEKKMWSQVGGKSFGGVTVTGNHSMWNAGVVALPAAKNREAVALALQICDAMCAAGVIPRLIEQFALSVALEETYGLKPADAFIGHYWGNKEEWNEAIAAFFLESYLKDLTIAQDIERIGAFDYWKLPLLKGLRKNYIRLHQLADKLFPPNNPTFLKS